MIFHCYLLYRITAGTAVSGRMFEDEYKLFQAVRESLIERSEKLGVKLPGGVITRLKP